MQCNNRSQSIPSNLQLWHGMVIGNFHINSYKSDFGADSVVTLIGNIRAELLDVTSHSRKENGQIHVIQSELQMDVIIISFQRLY